MTKRRPRIRHRSLPPSLEAAGVTPDGGKRPTAPAASSGKAGAGRRKADYDVGYGKPPVAHQFKKGKSGNPQGRPKGSRNIAIAIESELNRPVVIIENGRRLKLSLREVIAKRLVQQAVDGNQRSMQTLLKLDAELAATAKVEAETKSTETTRTAAERNGEILAAYAREILEGQGIAVAADPDGDSGNPKEKETKR